MRQTLHVWGLPGLLLAGFFVSVVPVRAEDEKHSKPPVINATDSHHKQKKFDLANPKQKEEFQEELYSGHFHELEIEQPMKSPLEPSDLGIWSLVIFLLLVLILGKFAWAPMLEGLQKREQTIKDSVDEAKKARAETERITVEFKAKMDQAYAEIPKMMAEARREADAFKEEMRNQTNKEIQTERQRLRREIETARDQALQELWNQAAQLATLISAKAIGRSLTEDDHRRLMDESLAELNQSAGRR